MKKFLILLSFIMCFSFSACSDEQIEDITDAVEETAKQLQNAVEDETVLSVKNAVNSNYPGITYGEAFDSFFAYPSWSHFTGSTEDSDEEHEVVEFTGNCTYQDVDVEALIQFTLYDDGTFKATYLSFNEVPQNMLMLAELIDTVFTTELETASGSDTTEYDYESENSDSDLNSAPPSYDYDSSENQSSSDGSAFVGKWWDQGNGRIQITISKNGDNYDINITGSSGAASSEEYYLTGYYDSDRDAVIYEGEKSFEDAGVMRVESINESGYFYFSNGYLHWHNNDEEYSYIENYIFEPMP
ncbi:MAG: hypothetical protein LUC97_09870 [Clostridiales bacterium]|nr:hypothetical protein [Clostridiales bacterium]